MLASYDTERRPVAARAVREASGNLARTLSPGSNPALLEETFEGALTRYEVGRRFSATMLREWYKLGIDLGYVYDPSPICWPGARQEARRAFPGKRLNRSRTVGGRRSDDTIFDSRVAQTSDS